MGPAVACANYALDFRPVSLRVGLDHANGFVEKHCGDLRVVIQHLCDDQHINLNAGNSLPR